MTEESTPAPDNSSINATINAVAGLAQAIPVYQDALQPAAKEVGKSLEVVAKVVGIALAPLKGVIWGYERIEKFINESVGKKLENVPEENIITPAANVVGPAIEALKFSGDDATLRELYANLIANAMDKATNANAHPAFVEIIRTITSDEAIMLKYFSTEDNLPLIDVILLVNGNKSEGYNIIIENYNVIWRKTGLEKSKTSLIGSYLNNLNRLGIIDIPSGTYITSAGAYDEVEGEYNPTKEQFAVLYPDKVLEYERKVARLTNFGKLFIEIVVNDKK